MMAETTGFENVSRSSLREGERSWRGAIGWWRWALALIPMFVSFTLPAAAQDRPEPSEKDASSERLGERLIEKARGEGDEDVMGDIQRMMDASSRKLEIDFDPGEETQSLQAKIMERLDEVIKLAASRRRAVRSSEPRGESDKRRRGDAKAENAGKPDASDRASNDPGSTTAQGGPTDGADAEGKRGRLRELRGSWGHLPMRDREEVIQGIGETFLERYRDWIERYYRALQENED
ncbi:MAG: hypothetical protein PVI86_19640 [Phycisphaerae bacterium]|jgi:hypothetical protein